MKKLNFLLLLVIGLMAGTQSFAQLSVNKGSKFLNLGIGVGGYGGIVYGGGGVSDSYGTTYVPFHLGGRYFFTESLGGFAELGSSLATIKIGLTLKL